VRLSPHIFLSPQPEPIFPSQDPWINHRYERREGGGEVTQLEELRFAHLNVLNALTNCVNAAIPSRKRISATVDGVGGV
jgi:hypothetical protein